MKRCNSLINKYNLSSSGLGTWAIGGDWAYSWGKQDDKDSLKSMLTSFELGVNWVDTSPVYGNGKAEELLGKALKEWKDNIFIASKCGLEETDKPTSRNSFVRNNLKRNSILKECDASLKRLGIQQIDLYQIHWPGSELENQEALETLLDLKKQGKIKHIGLSNFSKKQVLKLENYLNEIDTLQFHASLISRQNIENILSDGMSNLACLLYSPLENGILSNKFSKEWFEDLDKSDWRKEKAHFMKKEHIEKVLELNLNLKKIANNLQLTLSQLALTWLNKSSPSSLIIVGARNQKQAKENFSFDINDAKSKLTRVELEEIDKYYKVFKKSLRKEP